MDDCEIRALRSLIEKQHAGDKKQLEVIFSEEGRVLVEAPAGYGKTTTMISRIAYLLAEERIVNPKKILALTFSVNAALKIKRDTAEKLPALINTSNNPVTVSEKITATNYHGFCKAILSKHGYLIDSNLKRNINTFKAVGDDKIDKVDIIKDKITAEEIKLCMEFEEKIKAGELPCQEESQKYQSVIIEKMLPHNVITHNAELVFAIFLLENYSEIRRFYQNLYKFIIVDEFQDTNIISLKLIDLMINEETNLLFLGDSLQRIYGFIGALPNIMDDASKKYHMKRIVLDKNYRFKDNLEMLKLDFNTRKNAEVLMQGIGVTEEAALPAFWGDDQSDEVHQVVSAVESILQNGYGKIAVLCRARGDNASMLETELQNKDIKYFYGMFTDEDDIYVKFHLVCQTLFLKKFARTQTVNNKQLEKYVEDVKIYYEFSEEKEVFSLLQLLDALVIKVQNDYSMVSPEDKYILLLDIFENRQLKQSMEYIECDVILATVHGAKGLEWDHVFLLDLEQWVFPGYPTCILCDGKGNVSTKCAYRTEKNNNPVLEKNILEELSVFYVAITRARKQVYVSASGKRANGKQGRFSCFSAMKGVKLVKASLPK